MTPPQEKAWRLRRATLEDCRLYWDWANDPQVRAMAFHTEPIPWKSHQNWFAGRLDAPGSHLYVLENDAGTPVGQIRFDAAAEGVFTIDISVSAEHRGRGASRALIEAGESALQATNRVRLYRALVKPGNAASLALFRGAGYQHRGVVPDPAGQPAILLEKTP